ncbi:c-type cytochrome domain-containing protein [Runella sp.]|uniref:c-type cytochrome domain-containing protein n=1 Tax=Runella sp. TaxID=1960881 RepID=UPI003D0DA409
MILLQASDWAAFIGRFHPVLVHLPIGFLILAGLLEIGRLTNKIEVKESTVTFVLFWAAIGATLSCIAGYLLSLGGGYEAALLEKHKWQGIWVAVAACVAWGAKSDFMNQKVPFSSLLYLPALAIGGIYMMLAGHNGGSLTHGEGYLTQETPEPFRNWLGMEPKQEKGADEIKPIADVNNAMVFQDVVNPILKARCVQCHNANKSKGDLRMDQVELLKKGGENGPIFIAGKGSESDLIKRCLLPLEDENHMPPKGKTQLSEGQVAILSWWIDQGAPFDKKVAELKATDAIKPALAALSTGASTSAGVTSSGPAAESPALSLKVPVPDPKAVDALKKAGLLVMPIANESNLLEVNAVNIGALTDAQVALLEPLKEQIIWLKLGDTKISDQAASTIANLKNLQKLHLENTAVTDATIRQIKALPYLEYLNLVNTLVTDAGIKELAASKSLLSLHVWHSKVTEAGVAALKQAKPGLEVTIGINEQQIADFIKAGETAPKPEEAKKK